MPERRRYWSQLGVVFVLLFLIVVLPAILYLYYKNNTYLKVVGIDILAVLSEKGEGHQSPTCILEVESDQK
jgi:hypothetical protein